MNKTPKLRFKEFSGEWESKKLGELGEFKNGVNKSKEDFGHGYPFINLMDVFGMNSIKNGKFELVNATDKELNESNLIKGDVLFIRSSVKPSGVGLTAVILEDLKNTVYSGFLIRFRDNGCFNLNFKKYCFYNKRFRNELISKSSTSANTNINQENLKLLNINIPKLEEQEKIASFFSLIDDKISLQSDKVEALKDYKKGIMQKIFSRELRFKDDDERDYPDWEKIKMGDITVKVGSKNKDNYNYEVYSINNKVGFIPQNEQFEGSRLDSLDKSLYKIVNKGEFAYNPARINVGSIGVLEEDKTVIVSSLYVCFKLVEKMDYRFFNQYFSYPEFNKSVIRNTEGSVREYLFYENFSCIKMYIPCLEEQIKIADCLTTLDKKIEKEEEKLARLNEYKKGLLQQMFI
ncbi:type IC HsdS subunit [[Clostridium] sordellii]|uniref:restriction endonuclease subunit S n=1 Tax=Paraclostridium sordellii TaxID=1505 RepID=UPI0005E882EE|nr:restriction endonuclease subunit S [Paeniclostridium sordellii]CEQ08901.1 type IC HsdS subunit [[Clostridium] sordellii] [Paeniclostridium sordellii]